MTSALLDKMGARLAFERSGVRLYDSLIQKRTALGGNATPSVDDLTNIRNEELEHMHMLEDFISDLRGEMLQEQGLDDEAEELTGVQERLSSDYSVRPCALIL